VWVNCVNELRQLTQFTHVPWFSDFGWRPIKQLPPRGALRATLSVAKRCLLKVDQGICMSFHYFIISAYFYLMSGANDDLAARMARSRHG